MKKSTGILLFIGMYSSRQGLLYVFGGSLGTKRAASVKTQVAPAFDDSLPKRTLSYEWGKIFYATACLVGKAQTTVDHD
jgi:hypothetical protein